MMTDMNDWQPISTAPLDGTAIKLRSPKFAPPDAMSWDKRTKRWEGMIFAPMRAISVWWDEEAEQPTEWMPIVQTKS